jgi:transaldolase/glucose-6-phosphate isomerase
VTVTSNANPLLQLRDAGQSVWLDFLRRTMVQGGTLGQLRDDDGLAGVTSNPSIFAKAIGGSTDYDGVIDEIADTGTVDALGLFYDLALVDIQLAADVLRPVYDATKGHDGFVSFELEPRLARDTDGSVEAARRLWERIDRPNVMIKVPGTPEGMPVITELIEAGINVNVTLLFSLEQYAEVAASYLAGLESRLANGRPLEGVAGVASFFVSRVDTAVDAKLPEGSPLRGTAAVANAKLAYARFREIFSGDRWQRLLDAGAQVQRPLWASTSVKDPAYPDTKYVAGLAGPDTVNTMPAATMDAFRDHGVVDAGAVTKDVDGARASVRALAAQGVDLRAVTDRLLLEGLASFEKDFDGLISALDAKLNEVRAGLARYADSLGSIQQGVTARLTAMAEGDVLKRIWRKDFTVWKPDPTEISNRLGWLTVADMMHERVAELETFAKQASADGLAHAVLLGMGGSSLAPEVFSRTFGRPDGFLELTVLDTTHPVTVQRVTDGLDLEHTLFVVASKSGTTTETLSHFAHFWSLRPSGSQFVAITDPGTPLEQLAAEHGFRATFRNPDDIGGRYSALSYFGLVPAALAGVDLHGLLDRAEEMECANDGCVATSDAPSALLGAVMGEGALAGRDKLTLFLAPEIASFGNWVEQLIAESTGKEGRGIVPIVGEDIGAPEVYGDDRVFVAIGEVDGLDALAEAGHPVVRIRYDGPIQIGGEFFRWELATAMTGHILGINAFDQPNVAEAKAATKEILGSGPGDDAPGFDDLAALLAEAKPGDYVAIMAYLDRTDVTEETLHRARMAIRDRLHVATTLGFGPRFLHSTGQLHKGGPNTGVFVQVVDPTRAADLAIPGEPYTFGTLIDAQSLGDLRSLRAHDRRVARVTLEQLTSATP